MLRLFSQQLDQLLVGLGLKQAPRCWNKRFAEFLIKRSFKQSDADPCLFIRKQGEKKFMLALYVDDGLVAGTDKKEVQEFEKELVGI